MEIETELLSRMLLIDERHFSLNNQNCRIWSADNPHEIVKKELHNKKVTVWYGFKANVIIGQYFFVEIQNGDAVSVSVIFLFRTGLLRVIINQLKNC